MILRKAEIKEAEKILDFYRDVIESIKGSEFRPRWNESYPNLEFIETCIEKEELYICIDNDEIMSSFILNNQFDNDYSTIKWQTDAELSEITVIHTFAVSSRFAGKGYARKIFEKIKAIAFENNQKTLRIDIIDGNVGAQKVFKKLGIEYTDSAKIRHYAVGFTEFHLYEYLLKEK